MASEHSDPLVDYIVTDENGNSMLIRSMTNEEYEKELERIAEESKMEIEKLKEYIGDDEYGKKQIIEDLKIQKAIDLIVENAKEK